MNYALNAVPEDLSSHIVYTAPRKRDVCTEGITVLKHTGCGDMHITLNWDKHGLCEVFIRIGKCGGCMATQSEAIGRLISLALRCYISPEEIIDQLKVLQCPSPVHLEGNKKSLSCADVIGEALAEVCAQKTPLNVI